MNKVLSRAGERAFTNGESMKIPTLGALALLVPASIVLLADCGTGGAPANATGGDGTTAQARGRRASSARGL